MLMNFYAGTMEITGVFKYSRLHDCNNIFSILPGPDFVLDHWNQLISGQPSQEQNNILFQSSFLVGLC